MSASAGCERPRRIHAARRPAQRRSGNCLAQHVAYHQLTKKKVIGAVAERRQGIVVYRPYKLSVLTSSSSQPNASICPLARPISNPPCADFDWASDAGLAPRQCLSAAHLSSKIVWPTSIFLLHSFRAYYCRVIGLRSLTTQVAILSNNPTPR